MRRQDLEHIERLPLLAGLAEPDRERLLRHGLMQQVPPGTTLFNEGDRADFLHILLEGRVELLAHEGQRDQALVEVVEPVDNFILAAVVTDAPLLMTARTYEHSRLLLLPAGELRAEVSRTPEVALALLGSLAGQYRALVRQIKDLKLRTSTERVGCFLLKLAHEQGGEGPITLPYSKRVLAQRLNMTPENLSRAFGQLRHRGVRVERGTIVISEPETLARFCRPDTLIDDVERDLRVPGQPDD